jgi:hypothetical protein
MRLDYEITFKLYYNRMKRSENTIHNVMIDESQCMLRKEVKMLWGLHLLPSRQ